MVNKVSGKEQEPVVKKIEVDAKLPSTLKAIEKIEAQFRRNTEKLDQAIDNQTFKFSRIKK